MVYEKPRKMLLYGDACRASTDPIAKASYFFDMVQISYADTDPIYTIENYPNFFRVVPSENALSLARIPFIRHFNWTRVGTIYQNLPRYSLPHSKLLTDLERFDIVIKQTVSLPGSIDGLQDRDLGDELRKLKEKDVRIILGNFDEKWALMLFCEAFRERMIGRKYQWILTGVSDDKLWHYYKRHGSTCSEQELLAAMDGYIITDITPVTRSQAPTISGMMAHEFSNEYKRRAREMNIQPEENKFYGYVYDGVWAIALALNRVDLQLKYYNRLVAAGMGKLNRDIDGLSSLLDFDYHKPIWVKLIRNALNRTFFEGVTGKVSFQKNERPGLISFFQFQAFRDMNEVPIGSYDAHQDQLDLMVGFPILWRGSSPPIDYTIQRVTPFRINRSIFVILSILALFGIVLAFVFLSINIRFRNQRHIKMSSPYLNNLIIIGCILTYTSVIILGLDSGLTSEYNFPYICNARAWVLMAGFTLAFGSMFSKTFRVHSIFTNIKLHKRVIKDYKLFMVVFILLTLDICILIVWQYFDPFYRETNNGTSIQDSDNEDVLIVPEMEHCQSKRMTAFLTIIYVYKGLLMAFGCFLAWETRHVSIPALNDSKYIGLSVYNVVIMCVIGASLSFVLRDQQDASFVIISIFIIFCSTTTLCLVFVPKVRMLIELRQNPRAADQRVRATLKTFRKHHYDDTLGQSAACRDAHGNIIGRGFGVDLNEKIRLLSDENVKHRTSLKEKTYELEALTHKYRKIQNMVQSGNYLQVVNSVAALRGAHSSGALAGSTSVTSNMATSLILDGRTTQERVSFAASHDVKALSAGPSNQAIAESDAALRKSPILSSTTQLTITNTTDCTADLYSSRITSNATTTNSTNCCPLMSSSCSQGKSSRSTTTTTTTNHDCAKPVIAEITSGPSKSQRHTTFQLEKAASGNLNLIHSELVRLNEKTKTCTIIAGSATKGGIRISAKHSSNVCDSSYCSMGADNEFSVSRPSQTDDSKLFTAFTNDLDTISDHRQDVLESKEHNFSRWIQGPFCTLVVKGRPIGSSQQQQVGVPMTCSQISFERSQKANTNQPLTSCPNINKQTTPLESSCQQAKQQHHRPNHSSTTNSLDRNCLTRTLSMIEYLGYDDISMIARRHQNIELLQRQLKANSCCIPSICSYCNTALYRQTNENELIYSSSEPINSVDCHHLSTSQLSCSTCCSITSPYYASHSEIAGSGSDGPSLSDGTSTSSLSRDSELSHRREHQHDTLLCHHHRRQLENSRSSRHRIRQTLKQQAGGVSSNPSSSTTSSTSLHPNRECSSLDVDDIKQLGKVQLTEQIEGHAVEDPSQSVTDGLNRKYSIKCDILEEL